MSWRNSLLFCIQNGKSCRLLTFVKDKHGERTQIKGSTRAAGTGHPGGGQRTPHRVARRWRPRARGAGHGRCARQVGVSNRAGLEVHAAGERDARRPPPAPRFATHGSHPERTARFGPWGKHPTTKTPRLTPGSLTSPTLGVLGVTKAWKYLCADAWARRTQTATRAARGAGPVGCASSVAHHGDGVTVSSRLNSECAPQSRQRGFTTRHFLVSGYGYIFRSQLARMVHVRITKENSSFHSLSIYYVGRVLIS